MIRWRMSGVVIGGSGNEMSSIAIVSFMPGTRSSESGSASIGFSRAWRIAPFTSLMPGSESGG